MKEGRGQTQLSDRSFAVPFGIDMNVIRPKVRVLGLRLWQKCSPKMILAQ